MILNNPLIIINSIKLFSNDIDFTKKKFDIINDFIYDKTKDYITFINKEPVNSFEDSIFIFKDILLTFSDEIDNTSFPAEIDLSILNKSFDNPKSLYKLNKYILLALADYTSSELLKNELLENKTLEDKKLEETSIGFSDKSLDSTSNNFSFTLKNNNEIYNFKYDSQSYNLILNFKLKQELFLKHNLKYFINSCFSNFRDSIINCNHSFDSINSSINQELLSIYKTTTTEKFFKEYSDKFFTLEQYKEFCRLINLPKNNNYSPDIILSNSEINDYCLDLHIITNT
jgi:hypothetical protein